VRVVTFGEVMLRLAPPGFLRLGQVLPGPLEATFGGGEVNTAASIARQGSRAAFVTVLPDNPVTDAFVAELRRWGVEADLVRRSREGRFGAYFVETGANQRGGTVTYDRDGSSIALADPASYDWNAILDGADWLHVTGITPAIGARPAEAARDAVRAARQRGVVVSCDLNFRKKLWRWEPGTGPVELARRTMRALVADVDVVIANEEDADLALGIAAPHTDVESGALDLSGYATVARRIAAEFPAVRRVAITLRTSRSASHNDWGACLLDVATDAFFAAPTDADGKHRPYEIRNIVDRVGAGDAFAGGLIFALRSDPAAGPERALRYATAASCLKHSIVGDFNWSTREEIESLLSGSGSGRVQR
jgi:2-dehydro-3-deoxygluconokinase